MEMMEIIKSRHSVRQYLAKEIEDDKRKILSALVDECNSESGLHIQIVYGESKCMNSFVSKILRFKNCTNYIVIAGPQSDSELFRKAGYYGEKIVLKAKEIGLETCWVGATHGKVDAEIIDGEKYVIMIALGYGANQGFQHKSKPLTKISNITEDSPDWFKKGMEAAVLAPTAVNMQKFYFELNGEKVFLSYPDGTFTAVDAGIVKYHFEVVSGHKVEYK